MLDNLGAVTAYDNSDAKLPLTSQDVWDDCLYYAKKVRAHFGLDVS